jgi:uncharacterized membrane protein YgdD (TMEM256/DUF423 family)
MPKTTWIIVVASVFGCTSLILGAIGAHALDNSASWQTAVYTQTVHALFLMALVTLSGRLHPLFFRASALLITVGVLLFSCSIYIKTLTNFESAVRAAPYGGMMLMFGWLCLGLGAIFKRS